MATILAGFCYSINRMSTRKQIIFYADYDPDDLELMSDAMQKFEPSLSLIHANDGSEAFRKLQDLCNRGEYPCVIILDGNMPKLSGEETIEKIKSELDIDDIPLCIFSTSPTEKYSGLALKYQVKVYRKPSSISGLHEAIRSLIAHCKP